jgi:hypothetical protein
MEEIVNYIENAYEFEIVPCSIPASDFQYIKRNFYIWIMNSVSKKLFYFLRDKVSPIKFLEERPDGTIWLRKRMSDNKLCEIEVKTIYLYDNSNDYLISLHTKDELYHQWNLQIDKLNTSLIDKYIYQVPELKEFNRNKKLENILNSHEIIEFK